MLGVGYVYTEADIFLNPTLRLEDVELDLQTSVARYVHSFELLNKTARIEVAQGYQRAEWKGRLDGSDAEAKREGPTDTSLRLAVNLYGAPPLKGKEFFNYRKSVAKQDTIIGAGLVVDLPTGRYREDKLLNIGSNRFTFRPQLGAVHQRGKWSYEATGAAWIYTDNDDFYQDSKLENDPFYSIQGHVVYTHRPGLWASLSLGYGKGKESTINGIKKDDEKENIAWALSAGYPINKRLGVKVAYLRTEAEADTGFDSDSFALAASYLW